MAIVRTGKGDSGNTIVKLTKINKSSEIMEAIGTLDELSAELNYCAALCYEEGFRTIHDELMEISSDARKLCGYLSGFEINLTLMTPIAMRRMIEEHRKEVPNYFISFDYPLSARLNLARTVARRAERAYHKAFSGDEHVSAFLNILSDYMFCLSSYVEGKKRKG